VIGLGKFLVGLLATAGVTTTVVVAVAQDSDAADQAIVTKLVDGDTFDASINGRTGRIRLLNIDSPETKDPNEDVQCLGPEAAKLLESLIPVGTTVTLEYDEERFDQHNRTLAGIYTADGTLVNAEVARQGLATAVVIGSNDRFYPPVLEAQEEAIAQGRGLYSADVACTIPARVAAVTAAAESAPAAEAQPSGALSGDLDATASEVASVVALATELENAFAGERSGQVWSALSSDDQNRLAAAVTSARETAQRKETGLRSMANAAKKREAEAAEAARTAERERQAREAREREAREAREREAREAREREAREAAVAAERRRAQSPAPPAPAPRKPAPAPAPPPARDRSPSQNPYPGYTGPRCYEPGGKVWHPC
jgi:micrococcal nuclease